MITTTTQISRGSVLNRCIIDFKQPGKSMPNYIDYFFNTIANSDNDTPRYISDEEVEDLFYSRRCQTCISDIRLMAIEDKKLQSAKLRVLDLFAGGGGLSLGLTTSSRMLNAVSLDISPAACETLKWVLFSTHLKMLVNDIIFLYAIVKIWSQNHQWCSMQK